MLKPDGIVFTVILLKVTYGFQYNIATEKVILSRSEERAPMLLFNLVEFNPTESYKRVYLSLSTRRKLKLKIIEYPYVGAILTMEFPMNPCAKLRSVNIRPKTEKDHEKKPKSLRPLKIESHANVDEIFRR